MDNPYRPATAESDPEAGVANARADPVIRFLGWCGWIYPIGFVAFLYGTWLLAWIALGTMPVPMLNDPKGIPLIQIPYIITNVLMVGFPVVALAGALVQLMVSSRRMMIRFFHLGGVILVWILILMLLGWDPGRVLEWFFD